MPKDAHSRERLHHSEIGRRRPDAASGERQSHETVGDLVGIREGRPLLLPTPLNVGQLFLANVLEVLRARVVVVDRSHSAPLLAKPSVLELG